MATAKVPESPYPPDLFTGNRLTDPATVNAGRPSSLSLAPKNRFGDWQDPKQSYLIQAGPLPFASTYKGTDRKSRNGYRDNLHNSRKRH
jgi:hypothetical protein